MRKVLVVILLLLIGGVIVADRMGVRRAEDEIAKQVAAQYRLDARPDVTIHGVPFLTQAIGGNYDQIDVKLGEWTEKGVTVHDAALKLSGVQAPLADVVNGNSSQITVRNATASAVVPYSVVQKYAPQGVKGISASGSNLQARVSASYLGIRVEGDLVASLKATSQGIAVTPQSISNGGAKVPLAMLQQQYTFVIPTRSLLPMGARVSDIGVTPQGLRIAATADNVRLENLAKS
ncbi:DUF2993 domain-containing protein [Actinomadura sp. HBU206391]|uniref:LmeA family phospholipid-binding protein n=1 Tax=Actinomadura sp. HBU206391 TaxID=2731692 RepID=UPI00165087D0|nr:DUF2993 domain-containing protein [Actinomadura sp. HBU206391]MBC6457966.1 DUF2993 domain-containing protein [Actinomadura sp. HBU206391]